MIAKFIITVQTSNWVVKTVVFYVRLVPVINDLYRSVIREP